MKKVKTQVAKVSENKSEPALLSPAQVMDVLEAKIVEVLVPEWNAKVKCRMPTHKTINMLRTVCENEEALSTSLVKACLVDFTDEQMTLMEQAHGLRYVQLVKAVCENVDLFQKAMTVDNIKK